VDTDTHAGNQLMMAQRVNLYEAGLRQSPRLKDLAEKKATNEKAHITWALNLSRVITLFTLYSLVSIIKIPMPSFKISPQATFTEHAATRFHKVNELYNGTLNSICSYVFSMVTLDMSNNKVFTYTKAMQ
jgi:hypothetical protein